MISLIRKKGGKKLSEINYGKGKSKYPAVGWVFLFHYHLNPK